MGSFSCHHCEWPNQAEFSDEEMTANSAVERICSRCGSINMVTPSSAEDRLCCIAPEGFEWRLPSGRIGSPIQGYVYPDAMGKEKFTDGTPFSRKAWIENFMIDPLRALIYMRTKKAVEGDLKESDYDKIVYRTQ